MYQGQKLREALLPQTIVSCQLMLLALLIFLPSQAWAQEAAAQPAADPIAEQAAKLEGELGKYKDSSPEAAEVMARLVDLYHQHGRVLGLIRVAQTFTSAHPADPRHEEAMRKLMDGLEVMSRNNDLIIACRQFLERYPQSAHKKEVQLRLARTLRETNDHEATADAHREVWKQQGPNEIGVEHAVIAQRLYLDQLRGKHTATGAALAEEMFDRLPKNEFARDIALRSVEAWRIAGEHAKSNVVAQKLLRSNLVKDRESLRNLHIRIGENQVAQGQHRNAFASYQQARSIRDDADLHYRQLQALHNSQAAPQEIERLANDYIRKYPDQANRYHGKYMLAQAYSRAQNQGRAKSLHREMLLLDAPYGSNGEQFISLNGNEPPQVAESERILKDAINKNPKDAAYLRYVLAYYIYRDRLKDESKTRATLRDLVTKSPDNSGYTTSAISWLFSTAPDDKAFLQEVDRVVQSRRQHLHLDRLRKYPWDWVSSYRKHKDLRGKARLLEQKLKVADQDPVMKLYLLHARDSRRKGVQAREELLQKHFDSLPEDAARQVSYWQAHYYRHYASSKQRAQAASVWARHLRRFTKDREAAASYLVNATDYSPAEVRKEAALKLLSFPPESYSADLGRRLFIAADSNKDAALAKQALDWVKKARAAEKKTNSAANAIDPSYTSYFGDILAKYELKSEAEQLWRDALTSFPEHYESRECASRLLNTMEEDSQKGPFLKQLLAKPTPYYGRYACWLADLQFRAKDYAAFESTLKSAKQDRDRNPLQSWDFDGWTANNWLGAIRQDQEADDALRKRVYSAVAAIELKPSSAIANLLLLDLEPADARQPIDRLLAVQAATRSVGDQYWGWDPLAPFAQAALARKDFVQSATLATGMLANIPSVDNNRKEKVRKLVSASYARMGAVGLTIDETSPLAPLLQAALYLRLGDRRLAFEMYQANKPLFNEHRNELPVDLVAFICETLSAAGGDENFEYVEDVLRTWLVKNSESMQVDEADKARVQLLLAKNYFRAKRFDIARSEFTTVINRYPDTQQALDAEFGVGETFMEQKVFDQAERVFEKLSQHADTRTMVRADFLRGVLAFRRGDSEEARDIFRAVLERVPDVELANQTLFNLAEVYRVEERYIDQLNLLRTVGRLGQRSKRRHAPGTALSIVVHDSDLGISRGHNKIPVVVTTDPGGDREEVFLSSAGAGKGLFRFDLETQLGVAKPGDGALQVLGGDIVRCDYPDQFKAEFRNVPLSDVEISMAANAEFDVASSRIEDQEEQSFSDRLRRESNDDESSDARVSQIRPDDQIKPGNPIYVRIRDADRDISDNPDTVVVKVATDSGDEVQLTARETGAHSGVFEASLPTAELPAGALATDSAIDHSPIMAIDKDAKTFWQSQPDGATPKHLTVDMKGLFPVTRARVSTPDLEDGAPVRSEIQGSYDGQFWFRLAAHPPVAKVDNVVEAFGEMTQRVYRGNYTGYRNWRDVVNVVRNSKPVSEGPVETLAWERDDDDDSKQPHAVAWFGKLIQPEDGAMRISVNGANNAIVIDGVVELPLGSKDRSVDVWLSKGPHELTIFSAVSSGGQGIEALRARADVDSSQIRLTAFHAEDFNLDDPAAAITPAVNAAPPIAELLAKDAELVKKTEQFSVNDQDAISYWASDEDIAKWEFDCRQPGVFEVLIEYGHPGNGGRFDLELDGQSLSGAIANTGDWNKFQTMNVGFVLVESAGPKTLSIKPTEIANGGLMNLRRVSLRPAQGPAVVDLGDQREFRFPEKQLRYVRFVAHEYLGEAVAVNHLEIGDAASGKRYIPTEADILSLANNEVLEIAAGDTVTATYTDDFTQTLTGASQLLTRELTATYNNGTVDAIAYDYLISPNGVTNTQRKDLMRVDPGEEIVVEITDYDQDSTAERDTIEFEVAVNDNPPIKLIATETEANTGVFTRKVFTDAEKQEVGEADQAVTLRVAEGDRVRLIYQDQQNTFPGHAVPRRTEVLVNEPSDGQVRVLASTVTPPPEGSEARPRIDFARNDDPDLVTPVAFAAPLTIEVFDPDAAKDSRSKVVVQLQTTDGALLDVECVISDAYWDDRPEDIEDAALRQGRFVGQALMQLGGKSSPVVTPLTPEMPRNLIGRAYEHVEGEIEEPEDSLAANLVVHVLNVSGKDTITANYRDARRPSGKGESLKAAGRLVTQGVLTATDREYEKPIELLHVGEKLYLIVEDPDQDQSDGRDTIEVEITTKNGENEKLQLAETTVHSGVFTGSFLLKAVDAPTAGNATGDEPIIESYFGDEVRAAYLDPASPIAEGEPSSVNLPVVVGTDGLVSAFSKTFNDEELAVETKFRIAESYFELFKSHRDLNREDDERTDLEAGRRILNEVMEDYPDPKYAPRVAYLLGQFAQELGQWPEAIRSYEMIIQQHPDHTLAPDAQYKLAQCHEESGDFDEALEAYVTLAATHPKSPLIASVMIRISDYFYKNQNFQVAAQVGEKFLEKFHGHQHAAKIAFRVGQCYYKAESYPRAGESFDRFAKLFPDDKLGADALFWSGESYRQANNNREAFRRYNRCRWDFPASEAAKYARGRLALPEMLQQFEAEANSIDQDN